jgi:hypothetical protein
MHEMLNAVGNYLAVPLLFLAWDYFDVGIDRASYGSRVETACGGNGGKRGGEDKRLATRFTTSRQNFNEIAASLPKSDVFTRAFLKRTQTSRL